MPKANLDVPFVHHLFNSVEATLTDIFQCEVTRGQVYFWRNRLDEGDVAILTGVVGDLHTGMIVYSMKGDTAQRMVGFLDPSVNPTHDRYNLYEGLGEIINIISGNTIARFSKNNIMLDITTPSVIAGDSIELHMLNQATLSADMLSQFGTLKVNIAIKKFYESTRPQ